MYWQVTPQLALLSDVSWTDWSLVQAIHVTPSSPLAAPSTLVENWHDTVAVSVGANYNLTRDLMLQGGVGYDQSPVTTSNFFRSVLTNSSALSFVQRISSCPMMRVSAASTSVMAPSE